VPAIHGECEKDRGVARCGSPTLDEAGRRRAAQLSLTETDDEGRDGESERRSEAQALWQTLGALLDREGGEEEADPVEVQIAAAGAVEKAIVRAVRASSGTMGA
jgi:hypothetical protein